MDAVMAGIITGVCCYLVFMAVDHRHLMELQKIRIKNGINCSSNTLMKHRFWFYFAIVLNIILIFKNYQLLNFLMETN